MKKLFIIHILIFIVGCSSQQVTLEFKSDEPVFYLDTKDNMQGLLYHGNALFVGFDVGNGYGKIRKYSLEGDLIKESKPLPIQHAAELAYHAKNDRIYVANGGDKVPTEIFEVDSDLSKVHREIDLGHLGDEALIAVDNSTDELIIHTGDKDPNVINFHFTDLDGTVKKHFEIKRIGVPQGLDVKDGEIYYYTNDTITIIDFDGKITDTISVTKDGESEGLSIGDPYIFYGYNQENRIYAEHLER